MKTLLLPLLLVSTYAFAQSSIESDKYHVRLEKSNLTETNAADFSVLLNEEIAAIQFVSLLPSLRKDRISIDSTERLQTADIYSFESIFISRDSVDFTRAKNRMTLHHTDVQTLLEALFSESNHVVESNCYQPRHGIQFLNKIGQPIGFIEVCFDCQQVRSTVSKQLSSTCQEGFETIQRLFEKYMGAHLYAYDLN